MLPVLDEALEAITGLSDGDSRSWSEWHKRWETVDELAGKRDKSSVDELLNLYGDSDASLLLKKKIADALLRNRIRRGIPRIFGDLSDGKIEVRQWAYKALQSFYVNSLPDFDADGSLDRRTAQTEAIRLWLLNAGREIRKDR